MLATCSECGSGPGAFFIFGGTSAGSPQWAAITALADQGGRQRLGFLNPTLYVIGVAVTNYNFAFHDVLTGNNAWDVAVCRVTRPAPAGTRPPASARPTPPT